MANEAEIAPTQNKNTAASATDTQIGNASTSILETSAYPNILHNYSSYTYNLSLHMIPQDQYNDFSKSNTGYKPRPGNVLIAGAGRYPWTGDSDTSLRNEAFKEDFFFEHLSFETIIGLAANAQNANAISVDFTIIEPYGMTLINRLIDLKNTMPTSGPNKTTQDNVMQLPFMLQIDFMGYDDNGQPQIIKDISKFIPIQLIGVKFKVSIKGTEYTISAVPFNHQALSESIASTPIKLQIMANDLKSFFAANIPAASLPKDNSFLTKEYNTVENKRHEALINSYRQSLASPNITSPGARKALTDLIANEQAKIQHKFGIDTIADTGTALYTRKSYPEAFNLWHEVNEKRGVVRYADKIAFTLDDDLINVKFIEHKDANQTNKNMPPVDPNASTGFQDSIDTNYDNSNNPVTVVNINQGTSVLNVINMAMLNSDFIQSQIIDSTSNQVTVDSMKKFIESEFKWFWVVPSIEIGPYDDINNKYSRTITYNIQTRIVFQDKMKHAKQSRPKVIAKDYQYLFTGQNKDIINFDLNFDTQFYVVNVANPSTSDITATNANSDTPTQALLRQSGNTQLKPEEVAAILNDINVQLANNETAELRARTLPVANVPTSTTASRSSKTELAKQLERNILNPMGGDLIQVTLKIIGDPDFIKQDDIFFGKKDISRKPYQNSKDLIGPTNRKTPNQSLVTDTEDLFVRLVFKTPVDYDNTGLATPQEINTTTHKYGSSSFSGLYKVLTVKNLFNQGKFEQELSLVRHTIQPIDSITSKPVQDNQRENLTPANATKSAPTITAPPVIPDVQVTEIAKPVSNIISDTLQQIGPNGKLGVPTQVDIFNTKLRKLG